MGLITSGHSPSHIVMPSLSHGVTSDEYGYAPHTLVGALEPLFLWGAHPDCET